MVWADGYRLDLLLFPFVNNNKYEHFGLWRETLAYSYISQSPLMVARTYAKESLYLVGVHLDLDTHTLSNDIQVYTDLAIRFGLSYSRYLHNPLL